MQRIMFGHDNLLNDADLTPSSVKPSHALFPLAGDRNGNGTLVLSGAYTGVSDMSLEVEVVDTVTGSSPSVSVPDYRGVGNGVLEISAVDTSTVAQTITLSCASVGAVTKAASIDFYGVTLQARAAGADGNGITISIDDSAITATQAYTLLDAIEADEDTLIGVQYAFGGKSLVNGKLRSDAPRLRFGTDETVVYRQWSEYVDGNLVYKLSPKVASTIGAGTPVFTLAGTYSATITDGTTTEVFTGLVTLFDLLNAIRSRSALVEVLGVVSDDRTPSGMASQEIILKTDAHLGATTFGGSDWLSHLDDVSIVGTVTDTEVIELECINNDVVGGEIWAAKGSASGVLDKVVTGKLVQRAGVQFTIPIKLPPDNVSVGRIYVKDRNFVTREAEEGVPDLCLYRPILGSSASNKTLTWTWTARPPEECSCEDSTVVGKPDPDCLGLTTIEGDSDVTLPTEQKTRLLQLYEWRRTFVRDNTDVIAARLKTSKIDVDLIDQTVNIFAAALAECYTSVAAMDEWDAQFTAAQADIAVLDALANPAGIPVWQPNTTYSIGDVVVSTAKNGYLYMVYSIATQGLSAISSDAEPEWPAAFGSSVIDGYSDGTTTATFAWNLIGRVVQTDDIATETGGGTYSFAVSDFIRRYESAMDVVRVKADVLPKSNASTQWNKCWQDPGDAFYWKSEDGYLPAFSNRYYHSVVSVWDDDNKKWAVKDTYEFGFAIRVGCPERLKEGDQIVIQVETAARNITYNVGDVLRLTVLLGEPLALVDGTDGTDQVTWAVRSSVHGAWPDYVMPLTSPPAYTSGDVEFTISAGSVAFQEGDTFTFSVEGGHIRYRANGGAWSSSIEITDSITLPDGLSITPYAGASPSWSSGDLFAWRIEQPYSPETLKLPTVGKQWRWNGTGATLDIDLGAVQSLDAVALALHTLPSTSTITISGGDLVYSEWSESITVKPLVTGKLLSARTARYLRVTITGASGAGIGWLWIGTAWKTRYSAAQCQRRMNYNFSTGAGVNAGAVFNGTSSGIALAWGAGDQGGYLGYAELNELIERLDYSARRGNQVLCIIPNYATPSDIRLVRMSSNDVEISEYFEEQPINTDDRHYSLSIEFDGVFA